MRKTPLSAPGGSYGRKNNYDWNHRHRRQQHGGFDDRSGYGHFQNDDNKHADFSPGNEQTSPQQIGDDFIPLGNSSPVNHRPRYNNSANWRGYGNGHGHRGTPPNAGGGGFNSSYRHNFYHNTPKSSFDESSSPRFHQKHHFGNRRPHHKSSHRHMDISNYIDVKSFLEDPWADLMKNLEKRQETSVEKMETPNRTASGSSCGSILIEELTVKSNSSDLNLVSPESQTTVNEKSETMSTATTSTTATTTAS